jgi:hypothetical protein
MTTPHFLLSIRSIDNMGSRWYGGINLSIVVIDDDGNIKNPTWSPIEGGLNYEDLVVSCQMDSTPAGRMAFTYAHHVRYVDIPYMNLEAAESRVKTLRKVHKTDSFDLSFPDFMTKAGKTLKVKGGIVKTRGVGPTYADNEYEIFELDLFKRVIMDAITRLDQALNPGLYRSQHETE